MTTPPWAIPHDIAFIEAQGINTVVRTNATDICSVCLTHPSGITVTREGRGMISVRHEAVEEMRGLLDTEGLTDDFPL